MEPSTAQSFLINAVHETQRDITRLLRQVSEFDTVLTDPSVRGKERVKIRSRRHKALKRIEAFESQMHMARRALAETQSKAPFATNRQIAYAPAFVAYPVPVMHNVEWQAGPAWNAPAPDLWANPAEVSFQPLQWDQPASPELHRRVEDVSPLQDAQSPIQSLKPSRAQDEASKTTGEDMLVAEEVDNESTRFGTSCRCHCHSAPLLRSASW
jgi:hypothetical protein